MSSTHKKISMSAARTPAKPAGRLRGAAPKAPARKARPDPKPAPATRRPEPWHSVSIVSRVVLCDAAWQRRSQRYLSREAPRLPLSGGPPARTAPVQNLRLKRGRRKSDV
jgi:hypothetical protein